MSEKKADEIPIEDAESVSANDIADFVCRKRGIERPVREKPSPETKTVPPDDVAA